MDIGFRNVIYTNLSDFGQIYPEESEAALSQVSATNWMKTADNSRLTCVLYLYVLCIVGVKVTRATTFTWSTVGKLMYVWLVNLLTFSFFVLTDLFGIVSVEDMMKLFPVSLWLGNITVASNGSVSD